MAPAEWLTTRLVIPLLNLPVRTFTRTTDLVVLLFWPRLLWQYLRIWRAELVRSPYRWPSSFESVRRVKATGQTQRELMYGEAPILTAAWHFWRAGLRPGMQLVDLGAGRGRALIAARVLGARARGVELLPEHVSLVAEPLARAGATLVEGDALAAEVQDSDLVFLNWCAFSDETKRRIATRLQACRPGTRVVAVTRALEHEDFAVIARRFGLFSWGLEWVYVQEKRALTTRLPASRSPSAP